MLILLHSQVREKLKQDFYILKVVQVQRELAN